MRTAGTEEFLRNKKAVCSLSFSILKKIVLGDKNTHYPEDEGVKRSYASWSSVCVCLSLEAHGAQVCFTKPYGMCVCGHMGR